MSLQFGLCVNLKKYLTIKEQLVIFFAGSNRVPFLWITSWPANFIPPYLHICLSLPQAVHSRGEKKYDSRYIYLIFQWTMTKHKKKNCLIRCIPSEVHTFRGFFFIYYIITLYKELITSHKHQKPLSVLCWTWPLFRNEVLASCATLVKRAKLNRRRATL